MKNCVALILSIFIFSHSLSAQIDTLLLPYDATSLTAEQQASNPSVLAYPTALRDKIPDMKCKNTFTIDAEGHMVAFSKGNLQYNPSTNSWRFAENQWSFIGSGDCGNVYENGSKCDNENVMQINYSGWLDLFAWGTSNWVRPNGEFYWPTSWENSTANADKYHICGNGLNNLEGAYANADWGIYNQIGPYPPNTWHTLSKAQWNYIIYIRANSENLCGFGIVNGIHGCILLPDNWQNIAGIVFYPSRTYSIENEYSLGEWNAMEENGAIFLPKAGNRQGNEVDECNHIGFYWTTTAAESYFINNSQKYYTAACCFRFQNSLEFTEGERRWGFAIRLVRDIGN